MAMPDTLERIRDVERILTELRGSLSGEAATAAQGDGTAPSIRLSPDGKIANGQGGLAIVYRGDDNCPYGRTATASKRDFEAVVIHHTGPHKPADWFVQYQIDGDPVRGGHFGYYFYVAQNGTILQGAPLTKRTNHVKRSNHAKRRPFGRHARNANAIGVSCVGAGKPDFQPSAQQLDVLNDLVPALCQVFGIPTTHVYGHGELQTDRHPTEGAGPASAFRSGHVGAGSAPVRKSARSRQRQTC